MTYFIVYIVPTFFREVCWVFCCSGRLCGCNLRRGGRLHHLTCCCNIAGCFSCCCVLRAHQINQTFNNWFCNESFLYKLQSIGLKKWSPNFNYKFRSSGELAVFSWWRPDEIWPSHHNGKSLSESDSRKAGCWMKIIFEVFIIKSAYSIFRHADHPPAFYCL